MRYIIKVLKLTTKRESKMNIYQLNNLIAQISNPSHDGHGMLDFYKNMRKDLMKTLSKGIQEIIDNQ